MLTAPFYNAGDMKLGRSRLPLILLLVIVLAGGVAALLLLR